MTAAKRKGTSWESWVVEWLRSIGHVYAERRAASGTRDRGDIAGLPGIVIECKNVAPAGIVFTLNTGTKELAKEVDNDGATLGLLCVKRMGSGPEGAYWLVDPRHVPLILEWAREHGAGVPARVS